MAGAHVVLVDIFFLETRTPVLQLGQLQRAVLRRHIARQRGNRRVQAQRGVRAARIAVRYL
jgi:hypothetical protein